MKAQVLHGFDGPDGFAFSDRPEPAVEHDDDVVLEVEACGVCHRDITYARGRFGGGRLPTVMGHEGAGRVVDAGDGVTDLVTGDRVVHLQFPFCGRCEHCREGRSQLCVELRGAVGEVRDGCYAQRVVLPRRLLVPIPEGVPPEAAAVAACTVGTAYHALHLYGFSASGRTVAINGAGGGVGIHAIQVARALGARVVAVTSSEEKEERLRAAGADEVVVAPNRRYRLAMLRATDRRGADLFLEVVGAPTLQESVLSVGKAGRVVVVGNPEGGTCVFNPALMILRGELRMYGTLAVTAAELTDVLEMVRSGAVTPVIDTVAPLADLPHQMRRMEAAETVGRVVVTP
jgi:D-arabinose 1-dehydrogenase-like Zn-dependent alcohol dehydrogenase